jgi:uncharacterized membrane protein YdbT with pleckstrin-like domain
MNTANLSYDAHPAMFRNHPVGYLITWVLILAPTPLLLLFRDEIAQYGDFPPILLLTLTGAGILTLLYWYLKTRATRLRVLDEEVHLEEGLLSKHHIDLQVSQIRAVRVYQGFVDRVFRVGRIEIFTTGDSPEFTITGMPNPHRVREIVRQRRGELE